MPRSMWWQRLQAMGLGAHRLLEVVAEVARLAHVALDDGRQLADLVARVQAEPAGVRLARLDPPHRRGQRADRLRRGATGEDEHADGDDQHAAPGDRQEPRRRHQRAIGVREDDDADQPAAQARGVHGADDLQVAPRVVHDHVAGSPPRAGAWRARTRRPTVARRRAAGCRRPCSPQAGTAPRRSAVSEAAARRRQVVRQAVGRALAHHALEGLEDEQADQREAADGDGQRDAEDPAGHRARHQAAEPRLAGDARAQRLQHAIERQVIEDREQQRDHQPVRHVLPLLDERQRGEHAQLERADRVARQREDEQQRGHHGRVVHHLAVRAGGIARRLPVAQREQALGGQQERAADHRHLPEERERRPLELQLVDVHREQVVDRRRQPVPERQPAPVERRRLHARGQRVPAAPDDHRGGARAPPAASRASRGRSAWSSAPRRAARAPCRRRARGCRPRPGRP